MGNNSSREQASSGSMSSSGLGSSSGFGSSSGSGSSSSAHSRSLTKSEMIGKGNFGEVWRGTWVTEVAIKTLKPDSTMDRKKFLEEAKTMRYLNHPNIVRMYEAMIVKSGEDDAEGEICIVAELMETSLKSYLDGLEEISPFEIFDIAFDISKGMAYLEMKGIIHRDLAARNILKDNANYFKVADFGLARNLKENDADFYQSEDPQMPVRWTAPEALKTMQFTHKSDVWSFGVVLAEVVSCGETPYKDLHNLAILGFLEKGGRMTKTDNCPDKIYDVMLKCWDKNPTDRPSFEELMLALQQLYALERKRLFVENNLRLKLLVDMFERIASSSEVRRNESIRRPRRFPRN